MRAVLLSAEWAPRPGYQVSEFERRTGKAIVDEAPRFTWRRQACRPAPSHKWSVLWPSTGRW